MSTRVITIRSAKDYASAAAEGAAALDAGQLVGFATETVYGIAAVATRPDAIRRLRQVKDRPGAPFSIHAAGRADVARYVRSVPFRANWLMDKAWPGPVTLLLDTEGSFPDKTLQKAPGLYEMLTQDGVIGLRCPDEPVATRMLAAVGDPVVAPSANLAGEPSPRDAADVLRSLQGKIDLLIDSGPTKYGKDSSIVRFDEAGDWNLLRKGVFDERMLNRMMRRKIVFVCTGNTCRSPMAAGLAKKLLAARMNCSAGQLRANGLDVISAGLFASTGNRATPEAIAAAKTRGADISRHKSRKLTKELIQSCDMVFCMTEFHLSEAQRMAGSAAQRVHLLDSAGEIPDPIGGGPAVYEATADRIEAALQEKIQGGIL